MNSSYFGNHEPSSSLQDTGSVFKPISNVNTRLESISRGMNSVDRGMNYHNFGNQINSQSNEMMISEMLKQQRKFQTSQNGVNSQASNEMMMSEMIMQQRKLPINQQEMMGYSPQNMLGNQCNILLVENLPTDMANMGSVCNLFGTFGLVEDVKILERKQLVALVQMKSPDMAHRALLRQSDYKTISPYMNVNLCTDIESVIATSFPPGMPISMSGSSDGLRRGIRRRRIEDDRDGFGVPGSVLLINDMPREMADPRSIYNLFSLYGEIKKVQIMERQPSKALVETANPSHAEACRRYLNGIEVCGSKIAVSQSNKEYLGGHVNDVNFEEFRQRGRRGDKPLHGPTTVLFITNISCDKLEKLREYIVESGFTVLEIQSCGKTNESALVRMPSISEATMAMIKLQDTMPTQLGERNTGKRGLNIMFSPRAEKSLVSHCYKCNEAGHLVKDCPVVDLAKTEA